jgi:lysozyme family protein
MTERFRHAVDYLFINEGAVSLDPDDPGGDTIYGITSRDYPDVFQRVYNLYTSGKIELAKDLARRFYFKTFWDPDYECIIDSSLAFKVFDLSVNRGKLTAVKTLQRVIKNVFHIVIAIDGDIGPITVAAINNLDHDALYNEYVKWNEEQYRTLKNAWKYLKGWLTRLNKRIYI